MAMSSDEVLPKSSMTAMANTPAGKLNVLASLILWRIFDQAMSLSFTDSSRLV